MTAELLGCAAAKRHCVCGTKRTQPPRSPLAERVAERCTELGVPLTTPLHHIRDPQLLNDLGTMDSYGLHRVCGWPRLGRRLDFSSGRWAS